MIALLILSLGILFIFPAVFQYINYRKVQIIREEVLSLDSIANLYRDKALIPYFN